MSGILNILSAVKTGIAAAVDSYFNRVTLLLSGDGTNGAQNNTFLDSSSNAFSVTRNGNTTQGTFSPFSQTGWSNFFSSSYLSIPDNAVFDFGTADFTMECWVYHTTAASTTNTYYEHQTGGPIWYRNASGNLEIAPSGGSVVATSSTTLPVNAWTHIAVSRTGTTLQLFINGTSVASVTNSTNFTSSNALRIGDNSGTLYFDGYISNFRIIKGQGLFTGSFTPATAALTTNSVGATGSGAASSITGTVSLLTCQSNRFVDNSSNAFVITVGGTPTVQAFSPFAPTAAYSTSVVGGSGYFDGTGDYLSVARNSAFLPPANTDFTFEAWVYPTATPNATQGAIIVGFGEYGLDSDWDLDINSSLQFALYLNSTTATSFRNTTKSLTLNAWNHVAASRSGTGTNNLKVFVNGVGQSFTTNQTTVGTGTRNLSIGADQNGDEAVFTGYISGLRLINGQGIYTSDFTPPTSPPTTTSGGVTASNTALLLNFTNAGITDATAKNDLETVGNAQISTTQSKFGGSSMLFNGTSDGLYLPSNQNVTLGSGDFTIEGWVRFTANLPYKDGDNNYSACFFGQPQTGGLSIVFKSGTSSGAPTSINYTIIGTSTISRTISLSNNVWYHVAISRSSGTVYMFIDGALQGTSFANTTSFTTGTCQIGYLNLTSFLDYFPGYIDDLRVTKGFARYTTNFTPPTVAFPLQ